MKKIYMQPASAEYEIRDALMVNIGSPVDVIKKSEEEEEGEDPNGTRRRTDVWDDLPV